jgi:hypothetical protein
VEEIAKMATGSTATITTVFPPVFAGPILFFYPFGAIG